jgi:hypothetical protein
MSEPKPPDKKELKGLEKTVKTLLNNIVLDNYILKKTYGREFTKRKFIDFVLKYVRTASQSIHKGSILVNLFLLEALEDNSPYYDDMVRLVNSYNFSYNFLSVGLCRVLSNTFINDLWDKFFKGHPFKSKISKPQDICSQVFNNYGGTYDTNFHNSLWMNYKERQSRYIKHWLINNDYDYLPYFVQAKINNWNYVSRNVEQKAKEDNLPPELVKFIKNERKEMGIDQESETFYVYDDWLKKKERKIVLIKYYYKILSYSDKFKNIKKFSLAPITKISNVHIPIDSQTLYQIMQNFLKEIGIPQEQTVLDNFTQTKAIANEKDFWRLIFKVPMIQNMKANKNKPLHKRSYFTYHLDTDGYAVSLHFKKKDAEKKLSDKQLDALEIQKLQIKNPRIIAFDPGRTNILSGIEIDENGNYKKFELKKSEYYSATGMNEEAAYKKFRMETIAREELIFREFSLKTTKIGTYKAFIRNYLKVYQKLWKTKASKKWLAWKFRGYVLKSRFIDNLVNAIVGDVPDKKAEKERILIAYGDAKFSPTGKGERAGPTSWLSKQIAKKLKTVFINEYNTTKKCHDCEKTLSPVNEKISVAEMKRRKNKRLKKKEKVEFAMEEKEEKVEGDDAIKMQTVEIRGLKWCSTCCTLKNRDLNAALNIRKLLVYKRKNYKKGLNLRPHYLSRECKNPKKKPVRLSECCKKAKCLGVSKSCPKTESVSLILKRK